MLKTSTDTFWNQRPSNEADHRKVNIADLAQRELENDFLLRFLSKTDSVLEVGCGNGFLTQVIREHVKHVDAFDYAENMIENAKSLYKETNNRFFHDSVLAPQHLQKQYDAIVCVRVLINLQDLKEQLKALENLSGVLSAGGKIILIEGYTEGFTNLNSVRKNANIDSLSPAGINFYSSYQDIENYLGKSFNKAAEFHTGCFDFLTRVVYPALVGADNATNYSDFHEKIIKIAKTFNPDDFSSLARVKGQCWIKKQHA